MCPEKPSLHRKSENPEYVSKDRLDSIIEAAAFHNPYTGTRVRSTEDFEKYCAGRYRAHTSGILFRDYPDLKQRDSIYLSQIMETGIKIKQAQEEYAKAVKEKDAAKKSFRKTLLALLSVIVFLFVCFGNKWIVTGSASEKAASAAYSSGYASGSTDGLAEGKEKYYEEGYNKGHREGYSKGYKEGGNKSPPPVQDQGVKSLLSGLASPSPTPPTIEELVWIPVHGGTKYHSKKNCSGMKDPMQVTRDEAILDGFDSCGKCGRAWK